MTLIPQAPEGSVCPLHKEDVSKVCHKCPWWTHLIGKNPQNEEMIDDWRCAVAMLPMLLVENSQVTRGTTVAMETFRNGVVAGVVQAVTMATEDTRRLPDASFRRN
jgi:hypothetical protein